MWEHLDLKVKEIQYGEGNSSKELLNAEAISSYGLLKVATLPALENTICHKVYIILI